MKIYISSDHGGFELKQKIINELQEFELVDLGPYELNPDDDYPDFALNLAEKVASEPDSKGILICRSGNGMVIAANKVKGAYAALCFTEKHAKMARVDDNANIVALDADYGGSDSVLIVREFLRAEFAGMQTRHGRRWQKIRDYEETGNKPYVDKVAWIYIKDGKVLSTKSKGKDVYYFPGGKRDAGESDEQTLIREIKEELSVDLKKEDLTFIGEFDEMAHGKHIMIKMRCYTGDFEGELIPDNEIEKITWLSYKDKLTTSPVDQKIIEALEKLGLIE